MSIPHAALAAETRSSAELAACLLREGWESDAGLHAIATISYRGGQTEFDLGRAYAASAVATERALGADILSQLGWEKKSFHEESVSLLIGLLHDADAEVIRAAAVALGHRNDRRAIPPLIALIGHPEAGTRYGVAVGLCGHDDLDALAGLIELSRDPDDATRNWATFGLAQQTTLDTPALRDALAARLMDTDPEIRGEAMIGLASRKDERVFAAIETALRGPFHGDWPLEAIEHLAKPEWIPLIERHRENAHPDDALRFTSSFENALKACRTAV